MTEISLGSKKQLTPNREFVSNPSSDDELMLSILEGDKLAFELLVKRWKKPLFQYFHHQLSRLELAEDLAQEVFIKIWKTRYYRAQGNFKPWLYRLAKNTLIDAKRHKEIPVLTESESHLLTRLPHPETPEEHFIALDENQRSALLVKQALAKLPQTQRDILILTKFQGFKYAEVGEMMTCSANTVKVRIFRALQKLGAIIRELNHEN